MHVDVELSVLIGVGFYGCPNAYNLFLIDISIRELWKTLPTSDSTDDPIMFFILFDTILTVPIVTFFLSSGNP